VAQRGGRLEVWSRSFAIVLVAACAYFTRAGG